MSMYRLWSSWPSAIEAGAPIIVSFDNDLLILNPFEGIRIVKAREFLELLDNPV